MISTTVSTLCVAVSLGAASHYWLRASRILLPPAISLDVRPSAASLQEYVRKIGERSRLNARAGVWVAVAAFFQTVAMVCFLLVRASFGG